MKTSSSQRLLALVVTLLAGLVACGPEERRASSERPNMLLLVADDLGRSFVGAYGNDRVPTPEIDRLAAQGLRFDAAFTPTALCRPSRWAIYTGLYPHASGVRGFNRVPREASLLHEVLAEQGYRTGLLAKFGSKVQEFQPFDVFVGNKQLDDGQDVEGLARAAGEFFHELDEQPFFLIVGFGDPHTPYPPEPDCPAEEVVVPGYLPDLPGVRSSIAHYHAAIRRLDRGVSLLLAELERAGLAEETIVLFTSDHGPAFPFAKSTLYDAGVHVPLIVRWPGRTPAGRVAGALVSFVDLRPTLLAAAGIADPVPTQGRSFLPLLRGEPFEGGDGVFLSHTANFEGVYPMRAFRTADYKYVRNFESDREFVARLEVQTAWSAMVEASATDPELARRIASYARRPPEEFYVLESDPHELRNRIADPELAGEIRRMRERLEEAMRETEDPLAGGQE